MNALLRKVSEQVQRSIQGNEIKFRFLEGPWGRAILQFRSFMVGSLAKHTLRDLHTMRNGEALKTWASMAMSSFFAAASFSARVHAQSLGMSEQERKEFLEERLEPGKLALNAAYYTPALGVPMTMYGAVHEMHQGDPLLYRSTGLSNMPLPPALQWLG